LAASEPTASLKLFNTLTQRKEALDTLRPGEVGLYVCGPTVYSYVHLGNARTFTAFDVVVRYLRYRGYRVTYVRNVTDVDDRIIHAAQQENVDSKALADRFVAAFDEDMRGLGQLEPDVAPRVTDNMPEILTLVQTLLDAGAAYAVGGDVFFAVAKWPGYAKLSHRNVEELRAGERVVAGEHKRDPLDFALWKAEKPGEPAWDAPWGRGRPGWHIECSAMAVKFLGQPFDIHGGGLDLIFPHHDNEIAQSEAAAKKALSHYWMHTGFLKLENAKMSKSLGNVVKLRDALTRVDAEALRLFFLSSHYRNELTFSETGLLEAERRLEYFYETLARVDERLALLREVRASAATLGESGRFLSAFEQSMDDDFNAAEGQAALHGLFTEMNLLLDRPPADRDRVASTLAELRAEVRPFGQVLGIFQEPAARWLERRRERLVARRGLDKAHVEALIAERAAARKAKDWARADAQRDALAALGVELRDGSGGTSWKVRDEA
jgi:cysteinyl-tRNA synthetase